MSSTSASALSSRLSSSWVGGILLALIAWAGAATPAHAKVFAARLDAVAEAFGVGAEIESSTYVLTEEQVERVEALAEERVEKRIVRVFTARREGTLLGYAVVDLHMVRTLAEALLVVLSPEGTVRSVRVLAFHEPLDYLPIDRWYLQFDNSTRSSVLRVGRDIHAVVGSTLTTHATAGGVRRVLALYEVLIKDGD
ncbi:FMN-binding protein [Myxococcota bacterium]|nr:FMN-binding protein [Myxococcota bacterium]